MNWVISRPKEVLSFSSLFSRLSRLGQATSHIPNINWGGCCVFAALAAKELSKIIPRRCIKIRVIGSSTWDDIDIPLDDVRSRIKKNSPNEWNNNGVSLTHVFIEVQYWSQTVWFDSDTLCLVTNEVFPINRMLRDDEFVYEGGLSIEEAAELAYSDGWNTKFKRKHIPEMGRVINRVIRGEV